MLRSYGGLPEHYSMKFSELAIKKWCGTYEEGTLESLIQDALEHMKIWKPESYSKNFPTFISALKAVGSARDAVFEVRQEMLPQALALIELYK